jgi:UDP-N-acetylmuramoyl-tripeptide--D-alanyl-D-alanine ligase
MGRDRRTVAVLGQMNELGESSVTKHVAVGVTVGKARADWLLAGGNDDARRIADVAAQYGVPALHVSDSTTAFAEQLRSADVVLVKGSNSVGRMAVADDLAASPD